MNDTAIAESKQLNIKSSFVSKKKMQKDGVFRGLNPGPLAPKARMIPLHQKPVSCFVSIAGVTVILIVSNTTRLFEISRIFADLELLQFTFHQLSSISSREEPIYTPFPISLNFGVNL
ncbi:hypothetical protein BD770DRAFT_430243, partial [Pilaira anomala]